MNSVVAFGNISMISNNPFYPLRNILGRKGILLLTSKISWVVERELEIIGEATNHFLDIDPDIQIDNGRRVVGLRDFVIHGYDKEDNVII